MVTRLTYKTAGVDIESLDRLKLAIQGHMRRTFGPRVIENARGFAGLFALNSGTRLLSRQYRHPVLIGCADGVGTKMRVAFTMDKHDTIGRDLVAMNVNDLITQGGEPLFFLDYISTSELDPGRLEQVIKGIADGCKEAGCALLGGETAQMPGFYGRNEYELAGFAVGIVERSRILDGAAVKPKDVIIGIASSGLHSNGYSLVRKVFFERAKMSVSDHVEELGCTLGEELLKPTRIYARAIGDLRACYRVKRIPAAIANITGGGLPDNVERVLPQNCAARIKKGAWPVPPVFPLIQRLGNIDEKEMFHTFNMGIGMVLVAAPYYADAVMRRLKRAGETAFPIGEIRHGRRDVSIGP